MSLKAGIIGLPNVGKSTLFNAITKMHILASNYPFATIEPNVGVVTVPDTRLDYLASLYNPKKIIPTSFEFIDIAGLVSGASRGEGLGNKFLTHIRDVDAVVEVVRCFDDTNITHVEGSTNPTRDVQIINTELILADLEIATNRLDKIKKKADTTKDKQTILEVNVLEKAISNLNKEIPLRNVQFSEDELNLLKNFNFITLKKIVYVANIDENDISVGDNNYSKELKELAAKQNAGVIVMCAKLESELIDYAEEEKKAFLNELGISASGLDKLIFATYDILGLQTFFTAGADECRAWTFRKGLKAPKCAGIIHSDFEKGFIRAEVMSFTDLQNFGSELKVKESGRLRIEGKDYVMQDGDICYFRFNL